MQDLSAGPGAAKARVRAAALELFSANGFRATSVRDVMNACKLTPGALYAHYPSKESLLFDLVHEGHTRLENLLRAAAAAPEVVDVPTRLARLMFELVLYQLHHLDLARVATNENIEAMPSEMRNELFSKRQRINGYFDDTYAEGVERKLFDPESPRLTILAMLTSASQLTQWFKESGSMTSTQIARWHAVMTMRLAMCYGGRGVDVAPIVDAAIGNVRPAN
ncbi:MAG: TetR/AcrR family transcriptional regulator [Actinobacteria bacterium]|nr:TetR/AcrR family transcriptional regulator [Actinomycetota bacterium]